MDGLLELKLNEVVMILEVDQADPRPVMVKGIQLAEVVRSDGASAVGPLCDGVGPFATRLVGSPHRQRESF